MLEELIKGVMTQSMVDALSELCSLLLKGGLEPSPSTEGKNSEKTANTQLRAKRMGSFLVLVFREISF